MREKDLVLREYDELLKEGRNLEVKHLFIAFMLLIVAIAVFIPKIYLRNEIYFTSKEIHKLQNHKEILAEENSKLKQEIEDIKFKYLVTEIEGF